MTKRVSGTRGNFVAERAFFFRRRHRPLARCRLTARGRQVGHGNAKRWKERNGDGSEISARVSETRPGRTYCGRQERRIGDRGKEGQGTKNWCPGVTDNEDVNHMLSLGREGRRKETATRRRRREKGREKGRAGARVCF